MATHAVASHDFFGLQLNYSHMDAPALKNALVARTEEWVSFMSKSLEIAGQMEKEKYSILSGISKDTNKLKLLELSWDDTVKTRNQAYRNLLEIASKAVVVWNLYSFYGMKLEHQLNKSTEVLAEESSPDQALDPHSPEMPTPPCFPEILAYLVEARKTCLVKIQHFKSAAKQLHYLIELKHRFDLGKEKLPERYFTHHYPQDLQQQQIALEQHLVEKNNALIHLFEAIMRGDEVAKWCHKQAKILEEALDAMEQASKKLNVKTLQWIAERA